MCCNATNLIKSQFILRKNGKIVSSNYHLNNLKKKEGKKEREMERRKGNISNDKKSFSYILGCVSFSQGAVLCI